MYRCRLALHGSHQRVSYFMVGYDVLLFRRNDLSLFLCTCYHGFHTFFQIRSSHFTPSHTDRPQCRFINNISQFCTRCTRRSTSHYIYSLPAPHCFLKTGKIHLSYSIFPFLKSFRKCKTSSGRLQYLIVDSCTVEILRFSQAYWETYKKNKQSIFISFLKILISF